MPNWEAIVGERFAGLALEPDERREVIRELAAHLEDACDGLLRHGIPEEESVRLALSQVEDWQDLRRKIQLARNAENMITNRVRQWWLPGFVALFLSVILLMVNEFIGIKFGIQPLIVSAHGSGLNAPVAVIYVPWLLLLLAIGAMAAYLAWRAGGSQGAMLLSILFPVMPHLAFFIVALPVSLILDDHIAHNVTVGGLFMGLIAWVLLPGIALLGGGLPTQFFSSRRATSPSA
jgi:hypothetical protein